MTPIELVVTAALAILGWYAVHRLDAQRDLRNKRRDLRLEMLIDAYRGLAGSGNRSITPETAKEMERAIDSIQLIGTPEQVALAQRLGKEFADRHKIDWQPLLLELRSLIRRELDLESVEATLVHFRVNLSPAHNAKAETKGEGG